MRESKQDTIQLAVQEWLIAHMRSPRIRFTTPTKHAIIQPPSSTTLTFGTWLSVAPVLVLAKHGPTGWVWVPGPVGAVSGDVESGTLVFSLSCEHCELTRVGPVGRESGRAWYWRSGLGESATHS